MEAAKFKSILLRQKFALVGIPVLVMVVAFMLMRNLPNIYASKGILSAGIVDGSQPMSLEKNMLQETKINQQFSNLIQMMQMKKVYDQVSYTLILHDLTAATPYKKPSKLVKSLNADAKKHAIDVYAELHKIRQPLSLWDADQKGLNEVLKSMGYDYDALSKKLKIYRVENSDFITVEYESDSPTLSAFVVNTMCDEFIKYYIDLSSDNQVKAITYLDTLLEQKRDSLNRSMNALRNFKIENHVLNLNEQAKSLYSQMADFETRIELVQKEIDANQGALASINAKFNDNEKVYIDKKVAAMNQAILVTKQQINMLQDQYTQNNFDEKYRSRIDSLKQVLELQLNQTADRYVTNPITAKDNLIAQKLNLEVNLDLAKSSIKSLKDELNKLNDRFNKLVPNEAVIQSYEGNINVASQEYIEILKKHNQTSMAYSAGCHIQQIEMAMPGNAQPSKKMLLVAISGVGSFVFYLLMLFILFYLDNSIQVVEELANKTNFPVLGFLPVVYNTSLLSLNRLWEAGKDGDHSDFKNQLRSARFEIDEVMDDGHVLVVSSLVKEEGKSFTAMSLASAYIMVNKTVLLIDGNFNNPGITELTKPTDFIEDYLTGRSYLPRPAYNNDITILGNRGMDTSPFEISNEINVRSKIRDLRESFDIIIIEAPALQTLNQAKEWISVSDKVITVFESGRSLSLADQQQLIYLRTIPEKFLGWILNRSSNEFSSKKKKKNKSRSE